MEIKNIFKSTIISRKLESFINKLVRRWTLNLRLILLIRKL
jgi:hypothetical protein